VRKGERQRKNYGEIRERGKVRSKQKRTQERGKDREYNVSRAAHISKISGAVAKIWEQSHKCEAS